MCQCVCMRVNDATRYKLLEVPKDVAVVDVEDVALFLDHDVVVVAIREALWHRSKCSS